MVKKFLTLTLLILSAVGFVVSCNSHAVDEVFVKVESVSLTPTNLVLSIGDTATLSAMVLPDNAANKKVKWSSSNEAAVSVDGNGNVQALASGTADITVITEDGAKTAICSVFVDGACFATGTLISMADGSKKAVENLKRGDDIITFDHETGLISHAEIIDNYIYTENSSGVMTLHFADNIDVTVALGHAFYDKTEKKYVQITIANVENYINHKFFCAEDMSWKTLLGYTFKDERKDAYVVVTKNHLNCVADGMLANEDDVYYSLANVFEFDDNMQIIQDKKAADILAYGLWSYDDIDYLTEEAFDGLNLKYLGILVGKGILTRELIDAMCSNVSTFDPDIVRPEMR